MTGQEIVSKVRALQLPVGSYVVFGSCPMALAGLREANDIDMIVTEAVLDTLKQAGWELLDKGGKDKPYVHGDFEAHANWDFSDYSPSLKQLLETATFVDDVPFASLREVRKWKQTGKRLKDKLDVELIDRYLAANANAAA